MQPKVAKADRGKLSRDSWIRTASHVLAQEGLDGVRVERLAEKLHVTKGSFYWHFKHRDELCDAIIEDWRKKETSYLLSLATKFSDPSESLKLLVESPYILNRPQRDYDLSLSIRIWAQRDGRPLAAAVEIDELSIQVICQLASACGDDVDLARARSVLIFSYIRMSQYLPYQEDVVRQACKDILLDFSKKLHSHAATVRMGTPVP